MEVLRTSLLLLAFTCAALAASCTDGDTAAIDGKCRQYQVCKNGSWVVDGCNTPLRKYSHEQKKCMWWFQVDCEESSQCSEEGELLKNPYTCSSYYKCESGKLVSHSCYWPFYFDGTGCKFWASCDTSETQNEKYADPCSGQEDEPIADHCFWYKTCDKAGFFKQTRCSVGKYFNVETKTCEWFWKVDCSLTSCDGKARAPQNSDGKTFYQCAQSFLMKKTCGPLQKFDAEKGRCVFQSPFDSLRLETLREAVANATNTVNGTSAHLNTSSLDSSAQKESNVPSDSSVLLRRLRRASVCNDGDYQVDVNCYNYKVCVNNAWVSKRCPIGMIFSNKECRFYWEASCDPQSCITGTNKVYPQDCTKYYHCDDKNNQVLTDCPSGIKFVYVYHFNPKSLTCEKALYWSSCPSSSSYLSTCSEGGVYNPETKMCEKTKKSKRSVGNNPDDCISGDSKYDIITGVCSSYMFCTNEGRWVRRACPNGKYFDGHGSCSDTPCPYQVVPENCEAFRLSNGTIVNCDFGFLFDKITKQCVHYAQAKCAHVECEGLEKKNHPTSCRHYLQCDGQQWTEQKCGWFRSKFDIKSRKCVFGWWGHAFTCRYDPAKCLESSVKPAGNNCRDYVTCTDQTEREDSCFWPKKFDSKSLRCVWWGAKCTYV